MEILFITQIVPYPPHGGVLQRGYNLLRELSNKNRIHLAAFVHADTLKTYKQVEESRVALFEFCETVEYVSLWPKRSKLHYLIALCGGLMINKPFSVLAYGSRRFHRIIECILKNRKIEVVHFDTIELAQYLSRPTVIPSVVTHHNIESSLLERRAKVERFMPARKYLEMEARKLRRYEAKNSPLFDVNVLMSAVDEGQLKAMIPEARTFVVPNGVDLDYFHISKTRTEPAVIYTGGMNMFANLDAVMYFIRNIWPKVKAGIPGVRFDIVGQDPPLELWRIGKSDPGIKVHGYVHDIRPFVHKAAVYVVPIRVGGGTRLKVLDALSMGKAIVSTSVGCEGIDVKDNVNIIIEDNPIVFADHVVNLLNNEERRNSLGRAARRLAEVKYSWGHISGRLIEAYSMAQKCHRSSLEIAT